MTTRRQRTTGAVVFFALLMLSLYLWSPLHRNPMQGRQACPFFQFEQSTGLEAAGYVSIEPPRIVYCHPLEQAEALMASVSAWEQCSDRAPPA